jgi:lipid-binding SYLF domain-containing protein
VVQSARKDWQRHGSGVTQDLEEKRNFSAQPGTLTVRVLSAETRRDVSGAKYTAYILKVQHTNNQLLELEHRYSEFAKLRDVLQAHSILMPCAFPGKNLAGRLGQWTPSLKWAPEKHEDLIQYRKVQLDIWLVHVVEQYNLGSLPHRVHLAVYEFLTHSDRPPCEQENLIKDGHTAESWTRWNNPLSFTLGSTIRQAAATMEHMFPNKKTNNVWKESDQSIPLDLLQHAKGLCFLTVLKGGLVVSGRVGTGLLIARIDEKQWSAPCALGTVGMGWGMLAGGDITHYLVVLTTTEAVDALLTGTVQLGAELGVAIGPVGRGATSQIAAGDWSIHPAYSYAHSQGFFMGMSLEGSVLTTRPDVNAKFYGQHVPPSNILDLPPPKAAEPLYEALRRAQEMDIPEDAFRPSQLFQEKTYRRPQPINRNDSFAEPHTSSSGRVTIPPATESSDESFS